LALLTSGRVDNGLCVNAFAVNCPTPFFLPMPTRSTSWIARGGVSKASGGLDSSICHHARRYIDTTCLWTGDACLQVVCLLIAYIVRRSAQSFQHMCTVQPAVVTGMHTRLTYTHTLYFDSCAVFF
jgi:hypothetical protein